MPKEEQKLLNRLTSGYIVIKLITNLIQFLTFFTKKLKKKMLECEQRIFVVIGQRQRAPRNVKR